MSSSSQVLVAGTKQVGGEKGIFRQSSQSLVDSWTKNVIVKLKSTNALEKGELQRLNAELKSYLDNVRHLEALNKQLIDEVDKARQRAMPSLTDKSELNKQLESARLKLEAESNEAVRFQVRIEENVSLNQHITDRIRFFQNESEQQRRKIAGLQAQLADFASQRDSLLRSANAANDDIKREEDKSKQAELTLDNLRKQLSDARSRHKKVEFETQSVLDEIEFRKAVFSEEINDLRTRYNSLNTILPGIDINDFYKKELHMAIRQIKEDFHTLSQQQLDDYKRNKENELSMRTQEFEHERQVAEAARLKLQASADLEVQSSGQLKASLSASVTELEQEKARHTQLLGKLAALEERVKENREKKFNVLEKYQAEIDSLRDQNKSLADDLTYWDKVTRAKLEAEIQTYRSILNSQVRLMQTTPVPAGASSFSSATVVDINKNRYPNIAPASATASNTVISSSTTSSRDRQFSTSPTRVPRSQSPISRNEAIRILREIFDYFDRDRSGRINSFELDNILQRMNIQLSLESYNQLMREFDKDGSRDLDFDEFCDIMMPVYTGTFDDNELLYAFKKFDLDGSGYITVFELKQILAKVGQHFTDKQIASLIATVDSNSDGKLNYQEFSRLIKSASSRNF